MKSSAQEFIAEARDFTLLRALNSCWDQGLSPQTLLPSFHSARALSYPTSPSLCYLCTLWAPLTDQTVICISPLSLLLPPKLCPLIVFPPPALRGCISFCLTVLFLAHLIWRPGGVLRVRICTLNFTCMRMCFLFLTEGEDIILITAQRTLFPSLGGSRKKRTITDESPGSNLIKT